jgi:hypothetical protein
MDSLHPNASRTLFTVIKLGLPPSSRDSYRLVRDTPRCSATPAMFLALAAVPSARIKSDAVPVSATSLMNSLISSSVSRYCAMSNGLVFVIISLEIRMVQIHGLIVS